MKKILAIVFIVLFLGCQQKKTGKTTGWIHRASLTMKEVKMIAGVNYEKIDADGLHITFGEAREKPTLIEADTAVFYSNSFKGQYRTQGEDRIHRPGQVSDCHIVDFFHLPTDERAYDIITNDRRLEKMLLGEVVGESLEDNSANA